MLTKKLLRVLSITPLTFSLLIQALPATKVQAAPAIQVTPNNGNSTGKWMTGEFHAHTYESDDAQSRLEDVLDNAFTTYGLDWIATANHLRSSKRDDEGVDVPGGPIPFSQGAINYEVPKIKALQAAGKYAGKTIFSGFEWDIPTHDHAAIGILTDNPGSTEALKAVNQFEYLFTNRPENMFDANDVAAWKQNDSKITNFDHFDSLTAIKWLQKNYADKSYFLINHPSRGKNGNTPRTTITDLRDFNNAAPDINFGFEGMIGGQMEPDRGGYNTTYNIGNPTADDNYKLRSFGGSDYMIAKVGGVWDALLGEGRNYWNFANSDYHFKIINPYSSGYWPGEYAKNYTWSNGSDMRSILNGMRSGKSFSVYGDLINALDFNIEGSGGKLEMGAANPQVNVTEGDHLQLTIRFKSPAKNNYETPVVNGVPANIAPIVDHVDLIAGDVSDEKAAAGTAAYGKDTNDSTKVIATFTNKDWTTDEQGYNVITYDLGSAKKKQYYRLRGTNLGLNVPGETDAQGNPLLDPKTDDADHTTRFNNINDRNYKDLWFYSNPIFVKPTAYSDLQAVTDTSNHLVLGDLNDVSNDIQLPVIGEHGTFIHWESSMPTLISNGGKFISRPAYNTMVNLTATITRGEVSKSKVFPVIVKGINKANIELHGKMTFADGQAYSNGTWTNQNVTVSVYANVYAPSTSAIIELSKDGGKTYNSYESNSKIEVKEQGEHQLLFRGTDNLNNQDSIPFIVNIDKTAPVISLIGDKTLSIKQGGSYNEQGATATDNVELSGKVVITGTIDTNTPGTYSIHYNVRDLAGNTANEVVRTVVVYEKSSSGGTSSPAPTSPTPEIKEPSQTVQVDVKATQGSEGSIKDVVKFKIPAEAVSSDSKIHVAVMAANQAPPVGNLQALSQVLEFTSSSGHTFNKPVEITFNYKMDTSMKIKSPAVYYYNELQKKWIFIGGTLHSDGTVSISVKHFTKFAVFNYEPTLFTDLKGHWASAYTDRLIGMKAIQGYEDQSFQPEETVTRAQFASILVKALGLEGTERTTKFEDDSEIPSWAKADVAAAVKAGVISGYEDKGQSVFKANQTITRAEMSVIIANALKATANKTESNLKPFEDASSIPNWAQTAVSSAVAAGILTGYDDHTFRANNVATRAEASTMIYKLLEALNI
ncbi:S-layer homology domain-containing protein [Paenibacillus sp. SYP-B3998]|uniref:S-layer homology domain-containing protein n=1 Tax=Paenibacillus sp. SYP-B3998 TaxID=2678564 RepID=UPI00196873F9|nr:S-layer homology domain-containing protein [Paenibacillus sp. SYP-B3998]